MLYPAWDVTCKRTSGYKVKVLRNLGAVIRSRVSSVVDFLLVEGEKFNLWKRKVMLFVKRQSY